MNNPLKGTGDWWKFRKQRDTELQGLHPDMSPPQRMSIIKGEWHAKKNGATEQIEEKQFPQKKVLSPSLLDVRTEESNRALLGAVGDGASKTIMILMIERAELIKRIAHLEKELEYSNKPNQFQEEQTKVFNEGEKAVLVKLLGLKG